MRQIFKNLPDEYFRQGFSSTLSLIKSDDLEDIIMNKIGGSKPFLYVGEKWPKGQTFICQFEHPIENKYVRLFLNLKNPDKYQFDIINVNKPYQFDPIIPNNVISLECYKILSWQAIEEIINIESIFSYYTTNIDQFKSDFSDKLESEYHLLEIFPNMTMESIICSILQEEYIYSSKINDNQTLKVGGESYSELGYESIYDKETLFELRKSEYFKVPFIVGHLMIDNLNFITEFIDDE